MDQSKKKGATIAGFNGKLKLKINDTEYSSRILDLSEEGLSMLLESGLDAEIGNGMFLNDVEIYINDKPEGKINLEVTKKITISRDKGDDFFAQTKAVDEMTANKLWEIVYHHNYPQIKERIEIDTDSLPAIPGRGLYTEDARLERLEFIEKERNSEFKSLKNTIIDPRKLSGNIENFVGSVEVPVGLAGPLWINGSHAQGLFYAPLATSEGALVASATRGAKVVTRSGGITAHVLGQRMIRVPIFVLEDMNSALFFASWIRDHFYEIRDTTKKYSKHAILTELDPLVLGKTVQVRFIYETGDASGQNMTTTCTWHACLWILERMKSYKKMIVKNFVIEGNLSNDKKVSYQSFINGRGIRVMAEAVIPNNILRSVLSVSPQDILSSYQLAVAGSVHSGMIGLNINMANIIAAIFTSTGQDIACVHESSIGHFAVEHDDEGLYVSMTLPSLIIGTVGGGTGLPQQRECLEMMGCYGPGKVYKLAEIIASYCLALDLSTISAVISGQFAAAHEKLGRNRPVKFLAKADMNEKFFTKIISKTLKDDSIKVNKLTPFEMENMGSSIIAELTAQKYDKFMGHFPYRMEYSCTEKGTQSVDVMAKVKPVDLEAILIANSIASLCDTRLGAEYKKTKGKVGFVNCHIRELAVNEQTDPRFTRYAPAVYGIHRDDSREAYILIQEFLKNMVLMDTSADVSGWKEEHIHTAIDGIADVHSIWYNRDDELKEKEWIGHYFTAERMEDFTRLWQLLGAHANNEFPKWFTEADWEKYRDLSHDLSSWWGAIDQMPKTLIHNDFNPRNITFRQMDSGLRLCAYDWELATIHLPQHDCAELLPFVLDCFVTKGDLIGFAEYHRKALEKAAGVTINRDDWWEGFRYSCYDLYINRIAMYIMAHTIRHYDFMERVFRTMSAIMKCIE